MSNQINEKQHPKATRHSERKRRIPQLQGGKDWNSNPWVWVIKFKPVPTPSPLERDGVRPIIFSTPMVQAILNGRKTQTRRVIKESFNGCLTGGGPHPCPNEPVVVYPGEEFNMDEQHIMVDWPQVRALFHCSTLDSEAKCPYGKPGDLLWVRETWCDYNEGYIPELKEDHPHYIYKADAALNVVSGIWKPSIHMPKAAARIWLEITDITVEALQDISEDDALAEGVFEYNDGTYKNYFKKKGLREEDGVECLLAKGSFQSLWDSINANPPTKN